jgi:hypothetical protein
MSGFGRPVLRATDLAATLVQPIRPAWPIATKFHFDIWGAPSRYHPATEQPGETAMPGRGSAVS